MNQEVKKLWISALRSGEYEQGQKMLRNGDKFCCLGVLCDLYQKETGQGEWKSDFGQYFQDGLENTSSTHLTPGVMSWAGLHDLSPSYGEGVRLSACNDQGKDFQYIAARIEEHL